MLSLTRKSDYALVALVYLGHRWHRGAGPVSARCIAEAFDLPLPLLMNVLKDVAATGLISSTRGATGGYELARSPEDIGLRQIVHAVEGPDEEDPGQSGSWQALGRLHGRISGLLEQMALQDLLDHSEEDASPFVTLGIPPRDAAAAGPTPGAGTG